MGEGHPRLRFFLLASIFLDTKWAPHKAMYCAGSRGSSGQGGEGAHRPQKCKMG